MDNLTREEEYRLKLAEKLMDLGNLIIVGLVIGLVQPVESFYLVSAKL